MSCWHQSSYTKAATPALVLWYRCPLEIRVYEAWLIFFGSDVWIAKDRWVKPSIPMDNTFTSLLVQSDVLRVKTTRRRWNRKSETWFLERWAGERKRFAWQRSQAEYWLLNDYALNGRIIGLHIDILDQYTNLIGLRIPVAHQILGPMRASDSWSQTAQSLKCALLSDSIFHAFRWFKVQNAG